MEIITAAITIFLVMDPVGNIPVFVSLLKSVDPAKRYKIILREMAIALLILVIFLVAGKPILKAMQISTPALTISGGLILFLIALKMIFPDNQEQDPVKQHGEPFIVPLAIPLLAGPSAMATVMVFASRHPGQVWGLLLSLFLAWLTSTLILLLSNPLSRLLGEKGLVALERLMGMILTTLAVQMFLDGVGSFFSLG